MKHTTSVPEAMKMNFANWLKTTRKAKKVSMKTLAEAAGISTSAVAHHCEGINFPHETHPHILPAYEKVLGETWVYPPVVSAADMAPPIPKPADIPVAEPALLAALLAAAATGQFEIIIRSRTSV